MTSGKEFEIHLASDVISPSLAKSFTSLGYLRDRFIGGTTGVVHPCHFTCDSATRSDQLSLWRKSLNLLMAARADEFVGYGEVEVTPAGYRVDLPLKPFDKSVPFPILPIEYSVCPIDRKKDFDIHVTADLATIDGGLRSKLESEIGFHYVDIVKPGGNTVRVFTFQPLGVPGGKNLFGLLKNYFLAAGGLDGKIKLEVCSHLRRFPVGTNNVPPIVERIRYRA